MENNNTWEEIFNLYNTIKLLYALCEETDELLYTNLQPLNEFRASLDHLMRVVAIEHLEEYKDKNAKDEITKLKSHLRRAFFDIFDMLSINYRNKIIDSLEIYSPDEISKVLPDYYSIMRPYIEEITVKVSALRTQKRFNESDSIDEYTDIIQKLQNYYKDILNAIPSLNDIHNKYQIQETKRKINNVVTQWVIPIAICVVGAIIGIIGWFH